MTFEIPPRLSEPRTRSGLRAEEQHVEQARERRAVPAGGDVARAHVADDGRAGPLGDERRLAELQRPERVGALDPVVDRLAVRADHVDRAAERSLRELGGDLG